MKISYYAQKRIADFVTNIVMLVFLALTLLPIVWMVYSSLKDSTDIAIGKVGMRRAAADILSITGENDNLLVLSADGGISYFRKSDLNLIKRHSYKTAATSFLLDNKHIWLASGTRGLLQVNRKNIKESRSFKFPVENLNKDKIAATYIKRERDRLLITLEYKGFDSVMPFNLKDQRFERLIKGGKTKNLIKLIGWNLNTYAARPDYLNSAFQEIKPVFKFFFNILFEINLSVRYCNT